MPTSSLNLTGGERPRAGRTASDSYRLGADEVSPQGRPLPQWVSPRELETTVSVTGTAGAGAGALEARAVPNSLSWSAGARRAWRWQHVVLTLGVVVGLIWTLTAFADLPAALDTSAAVWRRPDLLGVFLATYSAAFFLRAAAWRLLLRTHANSTSWTPVPRAGTDQPAGAENPGVVRLFGFLQAALLANHVFPIKFGEVVRPLLLVRIGVPASDAAASTLIARLLDLGCLCALALGSMLLVSDLGAPLPAGFAAPLAILAVGLIGTRIVSSGLARPILQRCPPPLAAMGEGIEGALSSIPTRRIALALGLVLPSWLLEALALWSVATAAGVPMPFALAVGATAFTVAVQGLQVTPGGIGLYEATLTAALSLQGIDPRTALALAIATHALKFAYAYVVGLACLQVEAVRTADLAWARGLSATRARELAAAVVEGVGPIGIALPVGFAAVAITALAYPEHVAIEARSLVLASLAALPLVPLSQAHHLPPRLAIVALLPAGVAVLLFGRLELLPALIALPIAGLALAFGIAGGETLLWSVVSTQVIVAGIDDPLGVFGVCAAGSVGVVLFRQWWTAHRPLRPPKPLPAGSLIAVVIPVLDEQAAIGAVVRRVPRGELAERGLGTRVIVVDDGSSDDSVEVAAAAGADEIVQHSTRRGLGAALRTGLLTARDRGATAAVYLDGDGEYDPVDMPRLLDPLLTGAADYVLGVRFPSAERTMCRSRLLGNRVFTLLVSVLCGRRIADGQTGFRAFGPRALERAEIIHDYNYAQVLTLDLLRKGMRLGETSISYRTRASGTSFIRYREYACRVLPAMLREILAP
jgi:uncharacterized membrane protein YbhN (UPF0104 family)